MTLGMGRELVTLKFLDTPQMFILAKDFVSLMLCQGGEEAGRKERQDISPKLVIIVMI